MKLKKDGEKKVSVKLTLTVSTCLLAFVMALSACSPAADKPADDAEGKDSEATTQADAESDDGLTFVTASDFTERSTGLYPDVQTNSKYQNSGNRGCEACHTDLFDLDKDNGTFTHITTYVGLKNATYNGDCVVCHYSKTGTAGNIMSENMHVLHYSSKEFVENNGNCWSCHSTTTDDEGNIQIVLFEDIRYDAVLGGYPDAVTNPGTIQWVKERGWETGFLSGVSVDSAPNVKVELNQDASAEEDEFLIMNYRTEDENDSYATIDDSWTLDITMDGKVAKSFTLDDLKAMPQTEYTATQWCLVAGYNTAMVDNMPMKGVLLKDLVEAAGAQGYNTITPVAVDGWVAIMPGGSADLQSYIDANALLVIENYGHDLTLAQGGPAKLFIPGTGGTVTVKNLVGIEFSNTENPATIDGIVPAFFEAGKAIDINASWFDNDGVQGKVGEELVLEGAVYGWHVGSLENIIDKVLISFDYGQSWMEYDTPDSFDPDQWARFKINWTPEEAGTYILKVKGIDTNGVEQQTEASLIVVISE